MPGCRCAAAARSWLTIRHEAIADAPHREEMAGTGAITLEAFAQPEDEVVDRARRREDVVSPDPLEQVLARDDLAGVLGEHLEDHRLLLGERLGLAIPPVRAKGAEVDFVAAEAQYRCTGRGAAIPVPAPQYRAHTREELLQVERFRQIVVAARL